MSSIAGSLSLRCGRLLAVANTALITTKHIVFDKPEIPPTRGEPDIVEHANKGREETREGTREKRNDVHPSRDSKGYTLEGIDEIHDSDELFDE